MPPASMRTPSSESFLCRNDHFNGKSSSSLLGHPLTFVLSSVPLLSIVPGCPSYFVPTLMYEMRFVWAGCSLPFHQPPLFISFPSFFCGGVVLWRPRFRFPDTSFAPSRLNSIWIQPMAGSGRWAVLVWEGIRTPFSQFPDGGSEFFLVSLILKETHPFCCQSACARRVFESLIG